MSAAVNALDSLLSPACAGQLLAAGFAQHMMNGAAKQTAKQAD
jgi:hypothetical protein